MRIRSAVLIIAAATIFFPQLAAAGNVTLAWDANTEPELVGYFLCYGTTSGQYTVQLDVGNVTTSAVSNLSAGTYYFAVKAYGIEGLESAFSNEVSTTIAADVDKQAPTISGVTSSGISTSGATITWTTNEPADSQVDEGTSTSYSGTILSSTLATSHSQSLSGLTAATLYHYRVKSRDAAGNLAASGDYTFMTAAAIDTTPPIISNVKSSKITGSSAKITWNTDEAADSEVEYGTTTRYDISTAVTSTRVTSYFPNLSSPTAFQMAIDIANEKTITSSRPVSRRSPPNDSLVTSHSLTLNGLAAGTRYHYRVKSSDAAGNLAISGDYTFVTTAAADIVTGLAAAYTFDEGSGAESADLSGNGNTASIYSAGWTAGKYGSALSFNGIDSYVSAGTNGLPGVNEPKTVSFWAYARGRSASRKTLVSLANPALEASVQNSSRSSQAGVLGFGNKWAVVGRLPSVQTWHHFGYVFDGSENRFYVDGVLVSTSTILPPAAPVTSFEIGRWIDGSEYFEGNVDDLRIYTRALTPEEVKLAMNTPVADAGAAADPAAEPLVDTEKAAVQPATKPVVDIQLERQTYKQGETVNTRALWVSNPSTESRDVELKMWIALPGLAPISLNDLSVEQKIGLAPGFNQNFGVMPLLKISDDAPAGTCHAGARLVDPVTGEVLAENIRSFTVGAAKANRSTVRSVPSIVLESSIEDTRAQYRIENRGAASADIEVKVWLESPDGATIPAFAAGAEGSLNIPAGRSITFNQLASEGYILKARILDSASGELLSEK